MFEIKKEYVYIGVIIIASGFFFWISIVNSLRVGDIQAEKRIIETELENIVLNGCKFPDEDKWKNIIRDQNTCNKASITCSNTQYTMNNECGCGCIEL